jgi:2-C-methyl-D-erythritol 4-phosphate cytidylyltransferase
MQKYALIVAGGTGKRMGAEIPKQFLELAGKPVLMHTIERFYSFDTSIRIIVVLPENQFEYWSGLRRKFSFSVPHSAVKGGHHRFFSVKNGLEMINEECLVAIHDGVRPLVSMETIQRCFDSAERYGNGIPVISPADSLRVVKGEKNMPVNRGNYRFIQTPQVFEINLIRKAYQTKYSSEFTDDATVLERSGHEIRLVEGNRENIKITNPEDLAVANSLLDFLS